MYARFFRFKADPGRRSEVEALADRVFESVKTLQGSVSIHFVISGDETEYGSFSLWESQDDAIAAGDAIQAEFAAAIQDLATEAPSLDIYEVYKPG